MREPVGSTVRIRSTADDRTLAVRAEDSRVEIEKLGRIPYTRSNGDGQAPWAWTAGLDLGSRRGFGADGRPPVLRTLEPPARREAGRPPGPRLAVDDGHETHAVGAAAEPAGRPGELLPAPRPGPADDGDAPLRRVGPVPEAVGVGRRARSRPDVAAPLLPASGREALVVLRFAHS